MTVKLYDNNGRWHADLIAASEKLGVPPNCHPDVLALPIQPAPPGQEIAFKMRPEQLAEKARLKAIADAEEEKRVADLATQDAAVAAAQAETEKPVSKIAEPPNDVPAGVPPDVTEAKVS